MRRASMFVVMIGALGGAVGCSHEQQADRSASRPATPPRTVVIAGPARPAAPPPAVTEISKPKEGDSAIFFDFDSALVRDDARPVLQKVADRLHQRPAGLRIEGNCDEVGTVEYNLALGDQRARAAKEYLVHLGVPSAKIATVSYGSQRPRDPGHDDASRAQNRRDDLLIR